MPENNLTLFENKALQCMKNLSDLKKEQDRLAELEKTARQQLQSVVSLNFLLKSFIFIIPKFYFQLLIYQLVRL